MDLVNLAVGREHERLAFQETQEVSETRKDSQKERLERDPLYIEVGARGYVNNKWCTMSKALGMTNKGSKALRHQCSTIAQKCSFFIYLSRTNKEWVVRPLLQNHAGSSNEA